MCLLLSVGASANYGSNYNENKTASYSKMFMPGFTQNSVTENSYSNGGRNWSGSVDLNGRIDDKTWYNMELSMSESQSENSSNSTDSISNDGEGLISSTKQSSIGESTGSSYGLNGGLGKTFGKDDRYHLNIYMRAAHSDNDGISTNISESRFMQLGDSVRRVNHRIYTPSHTNNYSANVSINRQMGDAGYVGLGYRFSFDDGKSIQRYEDINADGTGTDVDSLFYDRRNRS